MCISSRAEESMTKLQKMGVVLLCWSAWVMLCGVIYAATGTWLMAKGEGEVIAALSTALLALLPGALLASGEIK